MTAKSSLSVALTPPLGHREVITTSLVIIIIRDHHNLLNRHIRSHHILFSHHQRSSHHFYHYPHRSSHHFHHHYHRSSLLVNSTLKTLFPVHRLWRFSANEAGQDQLFLNFTLLPYHPLGKCITVKLSVAEPCQTLLNLEERWKCFFFFRFSCIVWYCSVGRIVYNVNCMVLPGIAWIVIQAKVLFCEQNPEDDGVQFSLILGQSLVWMAFNVWAVLCWHFTTNWVASDLRGKVVALEIVQERIFTTGTDKSKFSDNQSDRKSCYSKYFNQQWAVPWVANSMVW